MSPLDAQPPHRGLRAFAAVAIAASIAVLSYSYTLKTVTFQRLLSSAETYSIFGGIESLWEDGNWILASIVFLFSFVFPQAKLLVLIWVWAKDGTSHGYRETTHWLGLLGKWSMLDVFVVGVFVGSIRLGFLADAQSHVGILVFALAIVMSMLSTVLVTRIVLRGGRRELVPSPVLGNWLQRGVTTLAFAGVVAALTLPLLEVQKTVFRATIAVQNEVALVNTTRTMADTGELLLALALGLFVIAVPVARALLLMRLRWFPGGSERSMRAALVLDEWAMLDVFGLGLMIVYVKLDELADTTLLFGFWAVIVASALAALDAWLFRLAIMRRQ